MVSGRRVFIFPFATKYKTFISTYINIYSLCSVEELSIELAGAQQLIGSSFSTKCPPISCKLCPPLAIWNELGFAADLYAKLQFGLNLILRLYNTGLPFRLKTEEEQKKRNKYRVFFDLIQALAALIVVL